MGKGIDMVHTITFSAFRNSLAAAGEDLNSWDIECKYFRIAIRRITTHFIFMDNVTTHFPNQYNAESLLVMGSATIRALPYPGYRIGSPPDVTDMAVGAGDGLAVGLFIPINQQIEFGNLTNSVGFRIVLDIANNSANDIYYRVHAIVEIEDII